MAYETIKTESHDGILTITFNRPRARNAMNSQMMREFSDELERWDDNPEERVCIITNSGTCFCAGADLKELAAGTYHLPEGKEDWGLLGMSKHRFKKPLIAAVNGICVGGGMGLLLACDLAICSSHSTFGLPEARRGRASTGDGAILRLMQQIPHKYAAELILVGDSISAEQALDWGLVSHVVDEDQLLPLANHLAEGIVASAPLAIEYSKAAMVESAALDDAPGGEGWKIMDRYQELVNATEDAQEGPRAFAEKRPPHWQGR
ncbi:MAG: enoyl-CoA hydratase/isomerase family protein [Eggerthellaceae bacterium]|jgi:crotonobetainyl-CoA hydratase